MVLNDWREEGEEDKLYAASLESKVRKKKKINKTYIIDVELVLLYYEKEETCETDVGRERIEFLLGCIEP